MSWTDPCSECGEHRADCKCGDWNGYERKRREKLKEAGLENWPRDERNLFICTKEKPMPPKLPKGLGSWVHDNVHETDADSDSYIEYKCHSCGHIWRTEMPE
jgi:hypothetical protein